MKLISLFVAVIAYTFVRPISAFEEVTSRRKSTCAFVTRYIPTYAARFFCQNDYNFMDRTVISQWKPNMVAWLCIHANKRVHICPCVRSVTVSEEHQIMGNAWWVYVGGNVICNCVPCQCTVDTDIIAPPPFTPHSFNHEHVHVASPWRDNLFDVQTVSAR